MTYMAADASPPLRGKDDGLHSLFLADAALEPPEHDWVVASWHDWVIVRAEYAIFILIVNSKG